MRTGYRKGELEGYWALFAKIAGRFVNKVPFDDREDFLHDMLVEMAKVKAKYEVKRKPLTEASLMKVASYEVKGYWDKRRRWLFGLNCTHCTSEQRRECYTMRLPSECPKRKSSRIFSLNKLLLESGDGHKPTELQDVIADYRSMDLDARFDARDILKALPKRLVRIGYKICFGTALKKEEKRYLKNWQRVHLARFNLRRDHLDERILEWLRRKPQGMSSSVLSIRLQVPAAELNLYLNRLIKNKQIIAVRRENTRGRPLTPLFFIAGAEIPELKKVCADRDERIRNAYFTKGWNMMRINRELHHHMRIIRRAIYGSNKKRK